MTGYFPKAGMLSGGAGDLFFGMLNASCCALGFRMFYNRDILSANLVSWVVTAGIYLYPLIHVVFCRKSCNAAHCIAVVVCKMNSFQDNDVVFVFVFRSRQILFFVTRFLVDATRAGILAAGKKCQLVSLLLFCGIKVPRTKSKINYGCRETPYNG